MQRPLLVVGCIVFGLGSLIVKFVDVGSYAIAFWRLLIAVPYILPARAFFQTKNAHKRKTVGYAILSGVFLAFDLALWHESIHAVGPGISTLLNSLQIFFLAAIGFFFLFRTFKRPANFKFDIGHHRRSLNRQPRVRS